MRACMLGELNNSGCLATGVARPAAPKSGFCTSVDVDREARRVCYSGARKSEVSASDGS